MLRVRYSETQDCADIVSVRKQDGQFVAVCRSWEDKREATGTGNDQSRAIIHAAMKLFQPGLEPTPATEAGWVVESDRYGYYFYDPDADKKPLTADMFRTKNAEKLMAMEERRRRELES